MNREAVKTEINNIIEATQASIRYARQHAASKKYITRLTELGIIDLMPAKFGNTDAQAVITAAENNGKMVGGFNAYGEGDVVKAEASTLYTLLNEVEVTPEPTPISHETMIAEIREASIAHQTKLTKHGWQDSSFWRGWDAKEVEMHMANAERKAQPYTGFAANLLKAKSETVMRSARNEMAVLKAALAVANENIPVHITNEMWTRYGVIVEE